MLFSRTLSIYILRQCERPRFTIIKTIGTIIVLFIPWRRMGSEGTPLPFLTSALVRWVISFTPRTLYPLGKSPQYPLREAQNQYGSCREEKNFLFLPGSNLDLPARSPSIYWLSLLLFIQCLADAENLINSLSIVSKSTLKFPNNFI
jgi:hypothetical protein